MNTAYWFAFPLKTHMIASHCTVEMLAKVAKVARRTVISWRDRGAVPRRVRARIVQFFRIGKTLARDFYRHWSVTDYEGPAFMSLLVGGTWLRLPLRPRPVYTLRRCDAARLQRAGVRAGPVAVLRFGEWLSWTLERVAGWWRLG